MHVFDPQGDVYLSISGCNSHVDCPESDEITDTEGEKSTDNDVSHENRKELDHSQTIQLQVSSTILKSCSRVFRALFDNEQLVEARTLAANGSVHIPLPDDNPDLFLIVMAIIYQRDDKIPNNMASVTLARIATIVDKYEFHQAVEKQAQIWIDELEDDVPDTFNDDMILWLWISWVFRLRTLFRKITAISQKETRGPLSTRRVDDVWLPQRIIDTIERRRVDTLSRIQSLFISKISDQTDKRDRLSSDPEDIYWYEVTRPLRAFRLGFLMLQASEAGIPCHLTDLPSQRDRFDGLSFKNVSSVLKEMDDPDDILLCSPSLGSRLPTVLDMLGSFVPLFGRVLGEPQSSLSGKSKIKCDFVELLACLENEPWGFDLDSLD